MGDEVPPDGSNLNQLHFYKLHISGFGKGKPEASSWDTIIDVLGAHWSLNAIML
jgi:hypothetical protein